MERESELVARASAGDVQAVDDLLARHIDGLEAFVRLRAGELLRERESVSDLVQSACREVLGHMERFRYGGERGFKAWLYETALRKIRNRYQYWNAEKRNAPQERLTDGDAARIERAYRPVITPSRNAEARETLLRLESAMTKLSDEERQVIVHARLLGLPHAEIADVIGKSEQASRTILYRALGKLTEELS